MSELWLLDKVKPPTPAALFDLEGALLAVPGGNKRAGLAQNVPSLAVRIPKMIIHDNKKWFGEADIRLDALIVHGHAEADDPKRFYLSRTCSFKRVADNDCLPIGKPGLLIFHGKPLYFLDIFLTVSRDVQDTEDLSTLLLKNLKSPEIHGAIATLLGLAVAAPQAAVITAALGAAVVLGDFARQILERVTGKTIGLYRNSYLQFPDGFGVGTHPEDGVHKVKDLSFSYEIVIADPPNP
jgi:hypothetical protein